MTDGPIFFLSYARADREPVPKQIKQFHDDLSGVVRAKLGLITEPGFLDTENIEPGDAWPEGLREALRTTRAFVPILSPTYFSRPYCGKEWAAFGERLAAASLDNAKPALVQPVLLVPPRDLNPMPEVISRTQYTYDRYPPEYAANGLGYLLTISGMHDIYWEFVYGLADLLVEAVRTSKLEPAESMRPLDQVRSAFHESVTGIQDVKGVVAPPGTHLFAEFVYVAATSSEVASLRQERSAYGDQGGLDWRPYLPDLDKEVGMIASEVAGREKFRYDRVRVDETLMQRIKTAVDSNKIVVVIVDPWTVRLEPYRSLMTELDGRVFTNCVVIVPVNFADAETAKNEPLLRQELAATFLAHHITQDPDAFVAWIGTAAEFEANIATALANAKMRVLRRHEFVRSAGQGESYGRPPVIVAFPQPPPFP